jgi:hypothetical protein
MWMMRQTELTEVFGETTVIQSTWKFRLHLCLLQMKPLKVTRNGIFALIRSFRMYSLFRVVYNNGEICYGFVMFHWLVILFRSHLNSFRTALSMTIFLKCYFFDCI